MGGRRRQRNEGEERLEEMELACTVCRCSGACQLKHRVLRGMLTQTSCAQGHANSNIVCSGACQLRHRVLRGMPTQTSCAQGHATSNIVVKAVSWIVIFVQFNGQFGLANVRSLRVGLAKVRSPRLGSQKSGHRDWVVESQVTEVWLSKVRSPRLGCQKSGDQGWVIKGQVTEVGLSKVRSLRVGSASQIIGSQVS